MKKKVTGDPGHGGKDPGAIGPTGTQEKAITLAVSKMVADLLKPVVEVKLTREDDRALGATVNADLQTRADMANSWGADVFFSIHCNSAVDRNAHGGEVYTTPGQGQADVLAESIIKAMEKGLPELSFRKDTTDGDSDKEAKFAVLTRTKMPAVLIELAFISNPAEEALLKNPEFQARASRAIAEGIAGYLGLQLPEPMAKDAVKIIVANQVLEGKLIDSRAYAPARALAEALGSKVDWNGDTRTVTIR